MTSSDPSGTLPRSMLAEEAARLTPTWPPFFTIYADDHYLAAR